MSDGRFARQSSPNNLREMMHLLSVLVMVSSATLLMAAPSDRQTDVDTPAARAYVAAGAAPVARSAAFIRPAPPDEASTDRNLFLKRAPCRRGRPPCHAPVEYEFDLIDLGEEYRGGARF